MSWQCIWLDLARLGWTWKDLTGSLSILVLLLCYYLLLLHKWIFQWDTSIIPWRYLRCLNILCIFWDLDNHQSAHLLFKYYVSKLVGKVTNKLGLSCAKLRSVELKFEDNKILGLNEIGMRNIKGKKKKKKLCCANWLGFSFIEFLQVLTNLIKIL